MKIGFSVKEKMYANIAFEIECEDHTDIENALDQIGDTVGAEDLYLQLCERYGERNVKCYGLNDTDNICPADEWEFDEWLDTDELDQNEI